MRQLHHILLPKMILVFIGLLFYNNINAKCIYLEPVKIKVMDMGNMLTWSTYKEVDNKFFVIEKSIDGIEFVKAGEVEGAGFSTDIKKYRFLDFSLGEIKMYYRIVHITSKGGETVSETFMVERTENNNLMITSMSSTVTDKQLSLTVQSVIDTDIAFVFKSFDGKVVVEGKKKVTKGLNALSFDCSKLSEGRYEVTIVGNDEEEKIDIRKVRSSEMPSLDYEVKQR